MEYLLPTLGPLGGLLGLFGKPKTQVVYQKDPAQEALLKQMKEQLEAQMKESETLRESFKNNQKRLEELQKEADQMTDPTEFAKNQNKFMDKFVSIIKDYKFPDRGFDLQGRKPVITAGPTSSGKSTLHNAIAGKKVAETGMDETTKEIALVHSTDNIAFFDAPGDNDVVKSYSFTTLALLKTMKCVIVVYKDDPNCVVNMIRICDALNVNIVCVRNQIDNGDETPEQLQRVKDSDLRKLTKEIIPNSNNFKGLFFISARNKFRNVPELYDWIPLVNKIVELTNSQ